MITRGAILFSIVLVFTLTSCAPKHSELVLAKYGDNELKMNEFENAYSKNVGGIDEAKSDSLSQYKNFLDLYVNFKMKLKDAVTKGYDKDSTLAAELIDYKKKVGVTYLLEKNIVEPGVKELYEKRKYELRVSHLMIRPDSTGEDAARRLAESLLDSIKNGAGFEDMVVKYSSDNYSKFSGGDIFYITAGQLPVEFEDAAYATDSGKVYPSVVQTRYGFHIIKVTNKQLRTPQIKASHILVDFTNDKGEPDSAAAKMRIDSVLAKLKAGEDFAKLAAEYSEDTGSKTQGGDLNYFDRRMMVKEFDEAAFNLKTDEYSDVVKTNFGYHIIKVTDRKPYPSFEDEKESLKKIFKQTRYQTSYDTLVAGLKRKYNYKVNNEGIDYVVSSSDSVKIGGEHPKLDLIKNTNVFSFAGNNVNAATFLNTINSDNEFLNRFISKDVMVSAVNKIGSNSILEQEALNLEKTNAEFASLMDDYKNGIYIFKLQDDEIWSKITLDSIKVYEFYEKTKQNYIWPDRINFSEIFSHKDSLINSYSELIKKGENFDSVAAKYTERPGFKEKNGNYGLVDIKLSDLSSKASKMQNTGDISEPFANAGGYSIIKLNGRESSRQKTFEEAKAEVSSAYQEFESKRLEQEYIDSLKNKFKPVFFYENLDQAFKE